MSDDRILARARQQIEASRFLAHCPERYFAIDPDGTPSEGGGFGNRWTQRPSAERRVAFTGRGVYDRREDKIIVEPDLAQFTERQQERADFLREEAREIDARVERVSENLSQKAGA